MAPRILELISVKIPKKFIIIPSHNKGRVMSSGKYLVSKSITLSTIMAQVKHIAKKACNETPKK